LIITPSKKSVKTFLASIRETIKSNNTAKQANLIRQLNPKIRGWTNYFRHVCSKKTFGYVSHNIFQALWSWAKRRHPNKSKGWIKKKYFRSTATRSWIFSTSVKQEDGEKTILKLFDAGIVPIKRHIKIKADATPYDPIHFEYLLKRKRNKNGVSIAT
jgi:RNA-directed DNA polymerase